MKLKALLFLALSLAALPRVSAAHHSFAAFDSSKTVTVSGMVREFQWANPHAWIQLAVNGPSGTIEEWSIEGGSPNMLTRQGWRKTSLAVGQRVSIRIHPLKSGGRGGSLMSVTFADGRVLEEGGILSGAAAAGSQSTRP